MALKTYEIISTGYNSTFAVYSDDCLIGKPACCCDNVVLQQNFPGNNRDHWTKQSSPTNGNGWSIMPRSACVLDG
jgi:hypothetical protein